MSFQDIRKIRRGLSPEEIRLLGLILFGIILLLALNIFLARILPGGEWLYLRWNGARAYLFESVEPYSTTIAERVQHLVYGRNAFSSEYGYVLNDPFYIVLLYTPLALFSDFSLARGLWMFLSEAALIASLIVSIRLSEWEPPRWLYISLIVFSLFGFYSVQSLASASPTIFLLFIYLSILLALRSFNDELAGALMFLVAYQWDVSALFFLFVIVAVIANKRWQVFTGFGMTLVVLVVVSFIVNLGWGLPYIRAVLSDWYRGVHLNLNSHISFWFPNSQFPIASVVAAILCVIVFLEWLGALRSNFRRVVWVAALSLAINPLLGFAIFESNYVVLLLPLVLALALVWERWHNRRMFATISILSIAFAVPFVLSIFNVTTNARVYSDALTVLPPVAAIVALYWMRWQVVRASRPWLEQVGIRP
ncbi:MAG: hypothetical protein DCC56_11250 [Anaerolineae bacterium]|nr:MAG: hypothetical protein DCC56_11250 [Anaerolineae bacterium]WKZ45760.1 MAG: glycosyltransferase 87 family protein [Anaerolineales bacterium]